VQQAAEQAAIEQCQCRTWVSLPEPFGFPGNVGWQLLGRDIEAC